MRNYHDKELIIHGSLEEARKEIILIKQNSIKYEEKLKKELLYKDKIILNLQSKLGLIDDIINEPLIGAHREKEAAAKAIEDYFLAQVKDLKAMSKDERMDARYKKLTAPGAFKE